MTALFAVLLAVQLSLPQLFDQALTASREGAFPQALDLWNQVLELIALVFVKCLASVHAPYEVIPYLGRVSEGQDKVNPGSVTLSGVLMLEHLGWQEAADLVVKGIEKSISAKRVTYDFHRLMEGATKLKCSEFGDEIIKNM